ncbi:hypothetical protein BGZ96_005236 [Linnemannia gamsii]|uniref:Uncharacterized protein n=1 Tax=Linnemannia gamsii TaxID=64522 RepID=A0ABQ7K5W5_9FUNG|nr:hypothetical protein BGZ96_005236 [Linnemannia gamsii]
MRTSISLTSILVLFLTATATILSTVNATPCEDCIYAGIYATSPTCDAQIFTNPFQGGPMTERQKSCFCPLASSDTWLQQCVKPDLCTTQDVNDQYGGFKTMKAEACGNAGAPNTTVTTTANVHTTTSGGGSAKPPSTSTPTSTSTGTTATSTGAGVRLDSSKLSTLVVVAAVGALL